MADEELEVEPETPETEEGEEAEEAPLGSPPDDEYNLVPFYSATETGQKKLEGLFNEVLGNFNDDYESSEGYREKRTERYKLLYGDLDPKDFPFEGCANVHLPIMLERHNRVVSRVYGEFFPEHDNVFGVLPSGPDDSDAAEILTLHGNFQIRNEIPDFFRQQSRGVNEYFASGSVFCHSYRDIPGEKNCHDILTCEELIIPYVWKTVHVDMSDIPRKTRIVRKFKHDLEKLRKVYENVDAVLETEASWEDGPDSTAKDASDQREGMERPDGKGEAPYVFLEQHTWWTFPSEDRQRPVIVTIHEKSKSVLALVLREEDDWRDRERFNRQMAEFEQWRQDSQAVQQAQAMEMQLRERLAQPDVFIEEREHMEQALMAEPLQPPPPPEWMKEPDGQPDPIRKVPIEFFAHGVCYDNLDGSLGHGQCMILEPFNIAANEALNRFYDAATLNNCKTYLVHENLQIDDTGETVIKPGSMIKVRGMSIDQLDKAIKEITPGPANPQLLDVVNIVTQAADGAISSSDVLQGAQGKSGETFRGVATRIEQASKQLTYAANRYQEFLTQILRNNAKLNAMFLRDEEIVSVVDHMTGAVEEIKVGRSLYERNYRATFTADTRFASQAQRVAEADQLVAMTVQDPFFQANPRFQWETRARALRARGLHDMVQFLGERPPPGMMPPPPPPGMPPGPGGPTMSPGEEPIQGPPQQMPQ